jgi:hypothetical protein
LLRNRNHTPDLSKSHKQTHSHQTAASIPTSPAKPREDHVILIEKPNQFAQTFSGFMFSNKEKAPE